MTVTAVRRTPHRGLMVAGRPARFDQAIGGTWNASAQIPATRALLAHMRLKRGIRVSLSPFPAQRAALERGQADGSQGRRARAAGNATRGNKIEEGFYAQLNNLDLGEVGGSGLHLFLTGFARIIPTVNFGTDPSGCPHASCPGTAWHVEAGFEIALQKIQLSVGVGDQKLTWTVIPGPHTLEKLKEALRMGLGFQVKWGEFDLDPYTLVILIGPIPVPVVLTQAIELTTDVKFKALFGIQSKMDFGLTVGAGVAWVPGNGPFYTGHL